MELSAVTCLTIFIILIGCMGAFVPPQEEMSLRVRAIILAVALSSPLWFPWAAALTKWNYHKAFPTTEVER